MNRSIRLTHRTAALILSLLLGSAAGLQAQDHADHDMMMADEDTAAVAAVVNAFHAALSSGNGEAAVALLAEDVRIMEGGGMETREHYQSGHLNSDMAFAQAVPRERSELNVVIQGDIAWVTSTSTAVGTYRGREIDSRGGELMVLSRTEDGWIIRAISWS